MEETNKTSHHSCKCSEILKFWWVKSLLGLFIFLFIFGLGVLFGHGHQANCSRGFNHFSRPQMEGRGMERGRRGQQIPEQQTPEQQTSPAGETNGQNGQNPAIQLTPTASQNPNGSIDEKQAVPPITGAAQTPVNTPTVPSTNQ